MEGVSLYRSDSSSLFSPALPVEENAQARTNKAALECLADRATFTGKHLPLQRVDGPYLFWVSELSLKKGLL